MFGEDFTFDSKKLSEYSMTMYDPEDNQSFVSMNIEKSDITSQRPKPNHFGKSYTDTLTLSFLILKDENVCDSKNDYRLTPNEINTLRAWLESPKMPTELVVSPEGTYEYVMDKNGNYVSDKDGNMLMSRVIDAFKKNGESSLYSTAVHYYGVFTNVQPFIHRGDCYGLYLTFTCNAPYGFSDLHEYTFGVAASGNTNATVNNYSAELYEYLKPTIVIKSSGRFGGETLTIKNSSDRNRKMDLKLPQGLSQLVIDCEHKVITDGDGNLVPMSAVGIDTPIVDNYNFISNDMYLIYWLSLVAGNNSLVFTPSSGHSISQILIRSRFIIKSGGF
jgi:hypothetical protein